MAKQTFIYVVTCGVLFVDERQSVEDSTATVEVFNNITKARDYIKKIFKKQEVNFELSTFQGDEMYVEVPDDVESSYEEPSFCYRIWKRKVK